MESKFYCPNNPEPSGGFSVIWPAAIVGVLAYYFLDWFGVSLTLVLLWFIYAWTLRSVFRTGKVGCTCLPCTEQRLTSLGYRIKPLKTY